MPSEAGPYLSVAAFCEQVIEDKSGVLSLIRIVDRLNIISQGPTVPETMPSATINWSLVLILKSGKARGSHPVKIETELPSGMKLPPVILIAHFEGENRGVNIISKLAMKLEMPGVYWFKVYVDDEFLTQIPVEVIYSRVVIPAPPAQ
ncbi:MAG: hypothetical protein HY669_01870 [Chloroflexi bacterium]|nr:hypothetical protein [Chloroflexota bacterium]